MKYVVISKSKIPNCTAGCVTVEASSASEAISKVKKAEKAEMASYTAGERRAMFGKTTYSAHIAE